MRYLSLLLLSALILSGCTKSKLEGRYIKTKENDRGNSMNILGLSLINEVNFGDKICRFDYAGISMSGEYTIDKNYVYINVGGELGTLSMEIIDNQTLEGEGWISGTFEKKINVP
jgi:hypothetical protein